MNRLLRVTAAGALLAALGGAVLPPVAPPAAAQERPTESEELRDRAAPLLARMPDVGRLLIAREIDAWDGLKPARRNRLERWIDLLLPLDAAVLEELFAPAMAVAADQRSAKAAELLDNALLVGVSRVPEEVDHRVVILCVSGRSVAARTINNAIASDGVTHPLMPQTVSTVRPWCKVLTKFGANMPSPELFLAVLLQGRSAPAIEVRNGSKSMAAPMIGEMYRKRLGNAATVNHVWLLYREAAVVADYCGAKGFGDKHPQIALYAERMQNLSKTRYADEVRDYRQEKKSPLDAARELHNLSAGKLSVDTLYAEKRAKNFIAPQVARAGAAGVDSNVFVAQTTAALLRSDIAPRIVVARLGGPEPDADGRVSNTQRDRFVRDTDRQIGLIWAAARSSDRWRGRTYFWLIVEGGSVALVAGPRIAPATKLTGAVKLTQVVPTVYAMLGLDPEDVIGGMRGVSKKPIADLFK